MKQLYTIWTILIPIISFGQFYDPDPNEHVGHGSFAMEFDKEDIRQSNIGEVEVWTYELKEDSLTVRDSILDYQILFNVDGLPTNFHSEYTMPVWWWPALKRRIGLERVRTDTLDYQFGYDSLNRLVHLTEYKYEGYGDGSYDQVDVWNEYDNQSRLVDQKIEEKQIYPPRFRHRGTAYLNDINTITVKLLYERDKVKSIYRTSDDYNRFTYNKRRDTLDFNCSFDSVLMSQSFRQGIELDSLNRIVKSTRFRTHVSWLGVGSSYVETENDIIDTHIYDDEGSKTQIDSYRRSGEYVSTTFYEYEDGLIQRIWCPNSLSYTKYKYKNGS